MSTLKSVSTLVFGGTGALAISFLTQPILTRLYLPSEIGLYASIVAYVSVLYTISHGGYDQAIVTAKYKRESANLFVLSVGVLIFVCFLLSLFLLFLLSRGEDFLYLALVPVLALGAVNNLIIVLLNRERAYSDIARGVFVRQVFVSALQVILGLLGWSALGLLLCQIIGAALSSVFLWNKVGVEGRRQIFQTNRTSIFYVASKFKSQLIYYVPGVFLASVSYAILIFCVKYIYGVELLGFYSMAFSILILPITVIAHSVHKVYLRMASDEYARTRSYRKALFFSIKILAAISAFIYVLLYISAEKFSVIYFGDKWLATGKIIALLCPMFAVRFVSTVVSSYMIIDHRQKTNLVFQVVLVFATLVVAVTSFEFSLSYENFLNGIGVSYLFCYFIQIFYVCKPYLFLEKSKGFE